MFKRLRLAWKIVAIALIGPAVIAMLLAAQHISDERTSAYDAIVAKSRTIARMAEISRDAMADKLGKGVLRPFDELKDDRGKLLEAVPIVTAMRIGRENARNANYTFRVPKESPRNPENAPDPLEASVLKELAETGLKEKIVVDGDTLRYFLPIKLTKECLYCHGDPKGAPDVVGGVKEGWKEGEVHGAFEIINSLEGVKARVTSATIRVCAWTAAILAIVGVLAWFMVRATVVRPLAGAREVLAGISNGDLTRKAEASSSDEIGEMAANLNRTSESLREIMTHVSKTARTLSSASAELEDISRNVNTGAEELSGQSSTVAIAAKEMSANMLSVVAAMQQATMNAAGVASASEEMSSTITDIAHNASRASSVADSAVDRARRASEGIDKLSEAAKEINKISETIAAISAQTNLLALNATIEAARAGDAGKGFAVVAGEIKKLANETAGATEEIKKRVESIHDTTASAITEISEVLDVIGEVSTGVTAIAGAVEQQSIATREIAHNIALTTSGFEEVSGNVNHSSEVSSSIAQDIAVVHDASVVMATDGSLLRSKADELLQLAKKLDALMSKFRI